MQCINIFKRNKNRFVSFILLFLFIISIFSGVTFAEDDESLGYSIPYANIDLYILEDGKLHVKEKLHYSFSGTYHGVYRDIPLKSGEKIENIKIYTYGAYSSYNVTNDGDNNHLKIYLYSDSQKKTPIKDKDVDVFIEYDFINVIKIYNDIAELHYKLWGEDWDVDVGHVNSNIHLKSNDGVKYWLNPPYFVQNTKWRGSILHVKSDDISSGRWFEVRMLIPKDQFLHNAPFAQKVDTNGIEEIEKIQSDYENELNFKTTIYSILAILMLLSIFIPVIIYFRSGREPKIRYNDRYERDLPTDDPPAVINAICGSGGSIEVGEPDMNGFIATIMDLINRKYINLKIISDDKADEKVIILERNKKKDNSDLELFESSAMSFLKRFEVNGELSLKEIEKNLKDPVNARSFNRIYKSWRRQLKHKYLTRYKIEKLFIRKGNENLKSYGLIGIVIAGIAAYFTFSDPLPGADLLFLSSIVLGLASIISLLLPEKVAGHWTVEGMEYNAKWVNFKRYIKDFSLINEYPPESIEIWNKYLVYATAFGIADNVKKSMEKIIPEKDLLRSEVYKFNDYGGYTSLSYGLDTGMDTVSSLSSSSGSSGAGGGSGGGGGGAF